MNAGFYKFPVDSYGDDRSHTSRPESALVFLFQKYFDPKVPQGQSSKENPSSIRKIPCQQLLLPSYLVSIEKMRESRQVRRSFPQRTARGKNMNKDFESALATNRK